MRPLLFDRVMKNRTDPAWLLSTSSVGNSTGQLQGEEQGARQSSISSSGSVSMRTGSRMQLTIRGPVFNICAYERNRQLV